jgi:hypothetical protein
LTIQSLAARTADHLREQAREVFAGRPRELGEPRISHEYSPKETWGAGMPFLQKGIKLAR